MPRRPSKRETILWTQNIWMGVSVEDEKVVHRIDGLRKVSAAVRFLSCGPLIGPLREMNLKGIDWVIVGGESGASPRPMDPEWAIDIRDQCEKHDVAFCFKQWGGRNKRAAGRELDGALHNGFPTAKNRRAVKARKLLFKGRIRTAVLQPPRAFHHHLPHKIPPVKVERQNPTNGFYRA